MREHNSTNDWARVGIVEEQEQPKDVNAQCVVYYY